MEQEKLLHSATAWQRRYAPARGLGEEIERYLAGLTGALSQGNPAAQAFMELLPAGLRDFCFVERYERGVLYVVAEPGAYMHELCIMRTDLLEQLRQRRPRVKIREIRIGPGGEF